MSDKLQSSNKGKGLIAKLESSVKAIESKSDKIIFGGISLGADNLMKNDFTPFVGICKYGVRAFRDFNEKLKGMTANASLRSFNKAFIINELKVLPSTIYFSGLLMMNGFYAGTGWLIYSILADYFTKH